MVEYPIQRRGCHSARRLSNGGPSGRQQVESVFSNRRDIHIRDARYEVVRRIRDTKKQAISAAANTQDAYVQNWTWAAIGWDYTAYALPASFELRHSYRNQGGRAAMPPRRRCFVGV